MFGRENVRSLGGALRGGDELDLHAVDTVDAVDEEDEDEHEADLHVVLNLGDSGTLRDEATPTVSRRLEHRAQGRIRRGALSHEDLPLDGEGQREDEQHEHAHLRHQEDKHLRIHASVISLRREKGGGSDTKTYESVVERHCDDCGGGVVF